MKQNPVINPRNNMPEFPQSAAPSQTAQLSTERETSSIPKTGSESKWVYPSPQQFYHALLRRNKAADEEAMDSVVFVHNKVNEDSWDQVMQWEALYAHQCKEPSLQRFVGKSEEMSIKARVYDFFNREGVLFDRHDWFVDRCGIKSVRYIIDYYDTSNTSLSDGAFDVKIDVRPAPDSAQAVWDRIRKPVIDLFKKYS
jgi:cytochrome c heme-lyase